MNGYLSRSKKKERYRKKIGSTNIAAAKKLILQKNYNLREKKKPLQIV